MVEYNPSRDKVNIRGTLVSVSQAERMVNELENALEMAEFHDTLDEDVTYRGLALDHLQDPSEKSYLMAVDITVQDDGEISKEMFSSIETERELSDMRIVKGTVEAQYIKPLHDTADELVSFTVEMP